MDAENLHKNCPDDQRHEAKGFDNASVLTVLSKNADGESEWLLISSIEAGESELWEPGDGTGAVEQKHGDNNAEGNDSLATGDGAGTWLEMQRAFSGGAVLSEKYGSSQVFDVPFYTQTADGNAHEIKIANNHQMTVPTDCSMICKGMIIAAANNAFGEVVIGDTVSFMFDFTIKNVNDTTSIVGEASYNKVGDASGSNPVRVDQGGGAPLYRDGDASMRDCTVNITADDTGDAIKIEVTGLASTTINWSGFINVVMVGFNNFDIN